MNELTELYQETIMDHNRHPHNVGVIEYATHQADGNNPLCGDRIHLTLVVKKNIIDEIAFESDGCAISRASASIMTTLVKGKTRAQALALVKKFVSLVTTESPATADLGPLLVFAGVREFPSRVKCASLAWHTLKAALEKQTQVSIE